MERIIPLVKLQDVEAVLWWYSEKHLSWKYFMKVTVTMSFPKQSTVSSALFY